MDTRSFRNENVNPSKHQNHSGLRLNLGTPVLTIRFLILLNGLDSKQLLKSKGSNDYDKNSSKKNK